MPLPTELLNVALLGTDQGSVSTSEPVVDALLGKNSDLSKETRLLLTSAGIALRDLAGYVPQQVTRETPTSAPAETAPVVNMAALRHLMVMLEGHHEDVLPEWLKAVAAAGKRIPEEALPLLLDMGRKQTTLRDLIIPVIGERGRWLAQEATSKEWGWIASKNPEKIWQEGDRTKRSEVLDAVRKRDPKKGRELLQSTWSKEKADERERFIFSLWHGISAEDEPFLEDALDDAAQAVRKTAQEMLATIPESRFYARMVERAEPYITLKKSSKSAVSVKIEFESKFDQSMARDGISIPIDIPENEQPKMIMLQLLGYLRPEWWRNHFGLTTEAILGAAEKTKSPRLYPMLMSGAYLANDHEMIEAVIPYLNYSEIGHGFELLPVAAAERVLMSLLPSPKDESELSKIQNSSLLTTLIKLGQFQWSQALTEAFLASLNKLLEGGKSRPTSLVREVLSHLAYYFPPEIISQIMAVIDVPTDTEKVWSQVVDHLRFTLEFRRDMLIAIKEN